MLQSNPRVRQVMYWLYAVAGLVLGCVVTYLNATVGDVPDVVIGAMAVVTYFGSVCGFTALSNMPSVPGTQPAE